MELDLDSRQIIEPAHGEEVVRALLYDHQVSNMAKPQTSNVNTTQAGTVFTAGEDGQIQAFRPTSSGDAMISTPNKSSKKKGSDTRYKPY